MKLLAAILSPVIFLLATFACLLFLSVVILVKAYDQWRSPHDKPPGS